MATRTGLKKPPPPLPLFILQLIGRLTYKTFFFLLFNLLKFLLYAIKLTTLILQTIGQLTLFLLRLPRLLLNLLSFLVLRSLQLTKQLLSALPRPRLRLSFPPLTPKKITLLALLLLSLTLLASFYFFILKDLPSPDQLITRPQPLTTKIYDRHGRLLYKIFDEENRTLVTLDKLPPYLIHATLAIEDAEFYHHPGFSWKGIFRSLKQIVLNKKLQGGSTITQQLVKNALLTRQRTLKRKVKEIILALLVELRFSKDEILQMYLNEVPYGGTAYGIEEAAQTYFGKSARDLTLAEAALLAGLPASPTTYSPYGAHPELTKRRQALVLQRMVEEGFITADQADRAKKQRLVFRPHKTDIKAPHFVMYVKDILVKKYGSRVVERGGLSITTSLDLDLQHFAEKVVKNEIQKIQKYHISNAAVLITAPQTGEILAMVGSVDYFNTAIDGNVNVTLRPRQPGSAIKPINYAVALQNGYTPATILADTPVTFRFPGSPPYSPRNYDGRFHGLIPLRVALASSYNVPAVKVLYSYGLQKMIDQAKKMGITTWNQPSRYGLSLTLGGAEVKMVDLAVAYGVFANLGYKVPLHPILKVTDSHGRILEKNLLCPARSFQAQARQKETCQPSLVLSPQVAYLINDILSDNQARTPAFGPRSYLYIPNHQVAVKTGTTNSKRDNWTIGYTSDYLVAVWVGNNDNSPMSAVASGVTGASPIWNKIITHLLKNRPPHRFPRPSGIVEVEICSLNGLLPCPGCPTRTELFIAGTEPQTHCDPRQLSPSPSSSPRDQLLEGLSTRRPSTPSPPPTPTPS